MKTPEEKIKKAMKLLFDHAGEDFVSKRDALEAANGLKDTLDQMREVFDELSDYLERFQDINDHGSANEEMKLKISIDEFLER